MALLDKYSFNIPIFSGLTLTATTKGLTTVDIGPFIKNPSKKPPSNPYLKEGLKQIHEYFQGTRKELRIPFDLQRGSDFERKVWQELSHIHYGSVKSYQDIAKNIGHSKSARAVGNANHKNPLPLFIPCHRVIRANGTLGGYGPGLGYKKKLIQLEQENQKDNPCHH